MRSHLAPRSLLIPVLLVAACASPVSHPWQVPGNDRQVYLATANWPEVPPSQVHLVKPGAVAEAVRTLGANPWVALAEQQAVDMAEPAPCPASAGLQPFLVRGVAHGGVASFTIVRLDPSTGWLLVSHGTYNGEDIFNAWAIREVAPLPVIVFLPSSPSHVLPTAEVGGDAIFNEGRFERRWPRECAA
jgi:hypothetical protein